MEAHFSHAQLFPCISSSASRRELPAWKTAVQMKLTPSPNPGLLRSTDCCGPGVQLVGCCSWKSPLGFQFSADPCKCASVGEKKIRPIHLCVEAPRGGCGRWALSISSCLILRISAGPWKGPEWSQPGSQEMTAYQSETEPGIYSLGLDG